MSQAKASTTWGPQQRARERELLAQFAVLAEDDPTRQRVRDELVTMHIPLVAHIARRYRDRGETLDDLIQVGTIGLIKAVDRFELERELEFSTYATPLILGEIKRHFRDRTWAVRMPRALQELARKVSQATEALTAELDRSPTISEIAARAECTPDEVVEAIEARRAFAAESIDVDPEEGHSVVGTIGLDDPALQEVENREAVRALLEQLPDREREIVILRFFRNMSQSQIAEQMGISQMHVSRLLAKSLAQLRGSLDDN